MNENELYHHGVKGMKWGHRKAQKYFDKAQTHRSYAEDYDPKNALYKMSDKKRAKMQKKYKTEMSKASRYERLGKTRQRYDQARSNQAKAGNNLVKNSFGVGIKGIARVNKAQKSYDEATLNTLSAKAKYNAAKAKSKTKADKAEFNTYRKAMQENGLPGSMTDTQSGGKSTLVYNKVKAEKGKAYADKVAKKVQNRAYAQIAASAAVTVGSTAVSMYIQNK